MFPRPKVQAHALLICDTSGSLIPWWTGEVVELYAQLPVLELAAAVFGCFLSARFPPESIRRRMMLCPNHLARSLAVPLTSVHSSDRMYPVVVGPQVVLADVRL